MCGIAGIWRRDGRPADQAALERMLGAIVHRGPDDSGAWAGGPAALGHRRLSIIDLSPAGHQPMLTPDGAGVLTYNGEVYNYRDLRRLLEAEGIHFHGTSDTEVVLQALHHWGPAKAIPLFNGMFAFAYVDRRDDTLWLARDRAGIKQVYVADTGTEVLFASEVKAILARPGFAARIDRLALRNNFIEKRRGHETLFDGIEGLHPGTWWKIGGKGIEKEAYFSLESALDIDRLLAAQRRPDVAGCVSRLGETFARSVRLHLASDAPVAAMCSGGVDSSLIAAYARDDLPDIVAYVADAPVGRGEGDQAERVARHIGLPIRRIPVERRHYLRLWALAIRHLDGPAFHQSEPALLAVTQACRADGIKVLLTGEGADELLCGYDWHKAVLRRWRRRQFLERVAPFLVSRRARQRWSAFPMQRMVNNDEYRLQLRLLFGRGAADALRPRQLFERLSGIPDLADRGLIVHGYQDMLGHLTWLLHRHDHMGMAASIEMRVPFIENDMIDLALHLPARAKWHRGQGKWAEKRLALERLPRDVVLARKKGFPMPANYTAGTEQLLIGGLLAGELGWSRQTTETIARDLAAAPELRYLAVGAEIWLRTVFAGETPDALGERLNALAA